MISASQGLCFMELRVTKVYQDTSKFDGWPFSAVLIQQMCHGSQNVLQFSNKWTHNYNTHYEIDAIQFNLEDGCLLGWCNV